jgi:hypothetical protein
MAPEEAKERWQEREEALQHTHLAIAANKKV